MYRGLLRLFPELRRYSSESRRVLSKSRPSQSCNAHLISRFTQLLRAASSITNWLTFKLFKKSSAKNPSGFFISFLQEIYSFCNPFFIAFSIAISNVQHSILQTIAKRIVINISNYRMKDEKSEKINVFTTYAGLHT